MSAPANLLGQTRNDLIRYFEGKGLKPYRATQLMLWVYHKLQTDFGAMTNIAKTVREDLASHFLIDLPAIQTVKESVDGTVKWIMQAQSGDLFETVLIPDGKRQTLCISSQIGCILDCTFCATGKQGFNGNLSTGEIVGQVVQASLWLQTNRPEDRISNIVFMGMGEPLLNFDASMAATEIFLDDLGFGLSRRRVTISTAGVVPAILDMCGRTKIALAVSLHAPNDDIRTELVPLNRKYPIDVLLDACRAYLDSQGVKSSITFEYSLIAGVNDSDSIARDLAKLLRGFRCKVNLIPFNPFPGSAYERPSDERIAAFHKQVNDHGVMAMCRTTRGDDIAAACGQLVGRVQDRTRRAARYQSGSSSIFVPVMEMSETFLQN